MQWNQKRVGAVLQTARLEAGLSLEQVSAMTGLKSHTVSTIERCLLCRPPNRATQAKLEEALGVALPVTRGIGRTFCLYVPPTGHKYIEEVVAKFPSRSMSGAVMAALKAWGKHQEAIKKWNANHPKGKIEE